MKKFVIALCLLSACATGSTGGFRKGFQPRHDLVVRACLDSELSEFESSMEKAMELWNDAAGRELIVASCESPTIHVVSSSRPAGSQAMMGYLPLEARIEVYGAVDTRQVMINLAHEFGHVLGLGHSSYGLMAPQSTWEPDFMRSPFGQMTVGGQEYFPSKAEKPVRVSDYDRTRIRTAYGRP